MKMDGKIKITEKKEVKERIIPLLFYDKDGKMFDSARKYFDENNLSIPKLQKELEEVTNIANANFWKKILKIISNIYESELDENELIQLAENDFELFIKEILKLRFEYEFREDEERIISSLDKLAEFFEKLKNKEGLVIEANDNVRVFYPSSEIEKGYTTPFRPGEIKLYPLTLVRIDKKNKKIYLNGTKKNRSFFRAQLTKEDKDIFQQERITEFKTFKINPYNFFTNLRDSNFYIRRININDPYFTLIINSKKEFLEVEEFINIETFFNDTLDFLNIKSLDLVYSGKLNNQQIDIPIKISIDFEKQSTKEAVERFFKINLIQHTRKKNINIEAVTKQITNKLKELGLEVNKSFRMPISYYFQRLIGGKEEFRNRYFEVINEIDDKNEVIKELKNKKIISIENKQVSFDEDKFMIYLKQIFSQHLKNEKLEINEENFEIIESKKDGNRINLRLKFYSDKKEKKYSYIYLAKIPFGGRLNKYDKIYYPILRNIKFYSLIEGTLNKNYKEVLRQLYFSVKKYIVYHYNILLEKEAYNSYVYIDTYLKQIKKTPDLRKVGRIIERHVNILLRYLFGNYLVYGGKNSPDGYLYLDSNATFIIDSKKHKKIGKGEFRKIKEYLDQFPDKEGLPKTKNGLFIVSGELIKKEGNSSLNFDAKKDVLQNTDYKVGFISLEFITKLFELSRNFRNLFKHPELAKDFTEALKKSFEKSLDLKTIDELAKSEEKIINSLSNKLETKKVEYLPQKKVEGL